MARRRKTRAFIFATISHTRVGVQSRDNASVNRSTKVDVELTQKALCGFPLHQPRIGIDVEPCTPPGHRRYRIYRGRLLEKSGEGQGRSVRQRRKVLRGAAI